MKSRLQVVITKDGASLTEIEIEAILRYWECDHEFNFRYSAIEVSKSLGKSASKFLDFLNGSSICTREDRGCEECNSKFVVESRTDLIRSERKSLRQFICASCVSKHEESRLKEADDLLLERMIERQSEKVELYNMESSDLIFFYAVAKYHYQSSSEYQGVVNSIEAVLPNSLYANKEMSKSVLERLEGIGLLHCYLRPDSQSYEVQHSILTIDFNHVSFFKMWPNTNLSDCVALKQLEDYLRTPSFVIDNHTELKYLALEIELSECIEYLKYCINNSSLKYYQSTELSSAISSCLEIYDVRQVFKFIWVAVKQADQRQVYKVDERDHKRAFNIISEEITSCFDRAQSDCSYADYYGRPRDLPRSLLGRALFEDILEDELYFKNPEVESSGFLAGYKSGARSEEIFFLTENSKITFNTQEALFHSTIELAEEAAFNTKKIAKEKEDWCPVVCDSTGHQLTVWVFSKQNY